MKKKDQPLDLVVKKKEKAAGRFKRARGLKALASVKWDGMASGSLSIIWTRQRGQLTLVLFTK